MVSDLFSLAAAALPVCVGVAVLRYRLYAIDRIISRVISYTIVTVAASTLASAGLFNPLRRRVQRLVDRRFNRARYDANQTVAAFTARLSDMADLDLVRASLAGAVQQSLQPAQMSMWIKPTD